MSGLSALPSFDPRRRLMPRILSRTSWGLLILTAMPVPAALWPSWLSEPILSLTHLLAGLAVILAVALVSAKWWWRAGLAILLAVLNLTLILRPAGAGDLWAGESWAASSASSAMTSQLADCARPVRVVTLNLKLDNPSPAEVADLLEAGRFDVAFLQEYNNHTWMVWRRMLDHLRGTYPHQKVDDDRDVAILSRLPFDDESPVGSRLDAALDAPVLAPRTIHAVTRIAGRDVALISAHMSSPQTQGLFENRNRQLTLLADEISRLDDIPVILGADLNGVRWNPHITRFLHTAGLRFLRHGFPPPATRPNWLPVLGVQIDYVAPTRWAFTGTQAVGPDVGSDHLPLEAILCPAWTTDSAARR